MGIAPELARGSVRLSLGHSTTVETITQAANALATTWRAMTHDTTTP